MEDVLVDEKDNIKVDVKETGWGTCRLVASG
jgi:hypothetical protein